MIRILIHTSATCEEYLYLFLSETRVKEERDLKKANRLPEAYFVKSLSSLLYILEYAFVEHY